MLERSKTIGQEMCMFILQTERQNFVDIKEREQNKPESLSQLRQGASRDQRYKGRDNEDIQGGKGGQWNNVLKFCNTMVLFPLRSLSYVVLMVGICEYGFSFLLYSLRMGSRFVLLLLREIFSSPGYLVHIQGGIG